MTLALATRGYLCSGARPPLPIYGPGPEFVDTQDMRPSIDSSGEKAVVEPPTMDGTDLSPSVNGANEPPATATDDGPTFVGSPSLTPSFGK